MQMIKKIKSAKLEIIISSNCIVLKKAATVDPDERADDKLSHLGLQCFQI